MSTLMFEPLRPALAVSALAHVAVLGLAMLLAARQAGSAPSVEAGASFRGDTFDVDELVESKKTEAEPETPAAAVEPAQAAETAAIPVKRAVKTKRVEPASASESKQEPGETRPAAAAATPSAESAGSAAPAAASAGQSGAEPGVANIAKAFAKAVTAATHKDPTWDSLPLGAAGSVRVTVHVDDAGKIEKALIAEREQTPAHLLRLVERTLLLLHAGRFALSQGEAKAGTESLRIEVTLSSVEAQEDYEDPRHTVAMGFEPPRPARPGRAYFVHAAGRRFDAKISIE